jgi:hypothetical protein
VLGKAGIKKVMEIERRVKGKGKGKFLPRTGYEGPEGE